MRLLLAAAVVFAGLFGVSIVRQLHVTPYTGLYVSAERGMLRVNAFDPYVWGIRYRKGFSTDAGDGTVAWKPLIFKSEDGSFSNVNVDVPLWALSLLAGAGWLLARRAGWMYFSWQCRGCGYDVRGIAAGVCPECGRAIAGQARLTTVSR